MSKWTTNHRMIGYHRREDTIFAVLRAEQHDLSISPYKLGVVPSTVYILIEPVGFLGNPASLECPRIDYPLDAPPPEYAEVNPYASWVK